MRLLLKRPRPLRSATSSPRAHAGRVGDACSGDVKGQQESPLVAREFPTGGSGFEVRESGRTERPVRPRSSDAWRRSEGGDGLDQPDLAGGRRKRASESRSGAPRRAPRHIYWSTQIGADQEGVTSLLPSALQPRPPDARRCTTTAPSTGGRTGGDLSGHRRGVSTGRGYR
jgi:hypothetical protein